MPFYEMGIIDTCENYRNFSHVPIRDFSVAEDLIKHCGFYNKLFLKLLETKFHVNDKQCIAPLFGLKQQLNWTELN